MRSSTTSSVRSRSSGRAVSTATRRGALVLRNFGGVEQAKERCRDARGT